MMTQFQHKIKKNIQIYKNDLHTKGFFWSIIHRLYKLPFGKSIFSPLANSLKPNYVIVNGNKLFIDKKDETVSQELIISGKWEECETNIFKSKIKQGDTVIDIGAHIGYYTLVAGQIVGAQGKVYAFEPDTENFSLLRKSVKASGLKNIILINKAVTDKNGNSKLFKNSKNTGDHRIYMSDDKRKHINIRTVSLDHFLSGKTKRVDFIKMDIQGAEVLALLGAKKTLQSNKNIKIMSEFQPALIKLSGKSAEEYLSFLRKNKFKIYKIEGIKDKMKLATSDKKLLEEYPDNDASETNFTNLFCTK